MEGNLLDCFTAQNRGRALFLKQTETKTSELLVTADGGRTERNRAYGKCVKVILHLSLEYKTFTLFAV